MRTAPTYDPVAETLREARTPLIFVGLFSFATNILYLAMPLYMAQVYDRVISSGSVPTLTVITGGVLFCFLVQGVLEDHRSRTMIALGRIFDRKVAGKIFAALFDLGRRGPSSERSQSLRDLDTIRQTLTGSAVGAMFDVPWAPIFIALLFVIDPIIGAVTAFGGVLILGVAVLQARATRDPMQQASDAAIRSFAFTEASLRNAEVARALGMLPALQQRWAQNRDRYIERQAVASEQASVYAALSRGLRLAIQVAVMAFAVMLVIDQVIAPGTLYASMLLSRQALAPLDRVVAAWNSVTAARQARKRLIDLFMICPPEAKATALPRPEGHLSVEAVSYAVQQGGNRNFLLKNLSFRLKAGEVLGIVGPSGAGKSTLVRVLVGIWPATTGAVRLDGADVHSWPRQDFGRYIGYMPQDVELFAGTARDNIARFRDDVTDEDVIHAAKAAGVHDLILKLPKGYDTELGENGSVLSIGQRQRVALARAVLCNPAFVVLDEPNANLDSDGEMALLGAVSALRDKGSTVVIVSHRPSAFRNADKILVLKNGQVDRFGDREAELARLVQPASRAIKPRSVPAAIPAVAQAVAESAS